MALREMALREIYNGMRQAHTTNNTVNPESVLDLLGLIIDRLEPEGSTPSNGNETTASETVSVEGVSTEKQADAAEGRFAFLEHASTEPASVPETLASTESGLTLGDVHPAPVEVHTWEGEGGQPVDATPEG